MPPRFESRPRTLASGPPFRALSLALGLLLTAPAVAVPSTAQTPARQTEPTAAAAARQPAVGERAPAPAPDRERLRRRIEDLIPLEDLRAAEARMSREGFPAFACEGIPSQAAGGDAAPRRFSVPTIIDWRAICWSICVLGCLGDGVPFDVCNDVCTDECYGGLAVAAAGPADRERTQAELEPLIARGAEILSPTELATSAPRRFVAETGSSFRCNQVACVCKGVRDCLALIDSGLCADFYCSRGPECACNREPGT